jgi:hypothetical protein
VESYGMKGGELRDDTLKRINKGFPLRKVESYGMKGGELRDTFKRWIFFKFFSKRMKCKSA